MPSILVVSLSTTASAIVHRLALEMPTVALERSSVTFVCSSNSACWVNWRCSANSFDAKNGFLVQGGC